MSVRGPWIEMFQGFTVADHSFQEQQMRDCVYVGTFSETQLMLLICSLGLFDFSILPYKGKAQ